MRNITPAGSYPYLGKAVHCQGREGGQVRVVEGPSWMVGELAGYAEHLSSWHCSPVRGGECEPIVCPRVKRKALKYPVNILVLSMVCCKYDVLLLSEVL